MLGVVLSRIRRAVWRVGGEDAAAIAPLTPSQISGAALRLAVAGDVGHPSPELDRTVAAMADEHARRPFDALVLLGDNVYPDGDPAKVGEAVLEPFSPILAGGVGLSAVLGNHDVQRGEGDEIARRLGMPARWYERWFGPIQLVALDSTRYDDHEQRDWLEHTLATGDCAFRIVALHHPPYSAGWHGSTKAVRRALEPAFRRHGVDLVLAGHEHDYQRSKPIADTVYVVSGAATHLRATGRRRFTASAHARHHFVDLWLIDEHVIVQPVGHDRQAFDRVVLATRRAGSMPREAFRPAVRPTIAPLGHGPSWRGRCNRGPARR
jgi:3',5'-cyclic AMP phosphodiesterase CpdA